AARADRAADELGDLHAAAYEPVRARGSAPGVRPLERRRPRRELPARRLAVGRRGRHRRRPAAAPLAAPPAPARPGLAPPPPARAATGLGRALACALLGGARARRGFGGLSATANAVQDQHWLPSAALAPLVALAALVPLMLLVSHGRWWTLGWRPPAGAGWL